MRTRRQSGFSLLELMAAVTIFVLIAAVSMQITDGAMDNADRAIRARELRYLAELKLEEVKLFAEEYDDILDGDFGDDLEDERYAGFTWSLDIRDVVMFGDAASQDAEYYFEEPGEEDEDKPKTASEQATNAKAQELRELTLRVSTPTEQGPADVVELVVLLPLVR